VATPENRATMSSTHPTWRSRCHRIVRHARRRAGPALPRAATGHQRDADDHVAETMTNCRPTPSSIEANMRTDGRQDEHPDHLHQGDDRTIQSSVSYAEENHETFIRPQIGNSQRHSEQADA